MYLLFDIGGTKMRIGISKEESKIDDFRIVPSPQNFYEAVQLFKNIAFSLTLGQKIDAIAGGIAGPLDAHKSKMVHSPNLPEWINKPLREELSLGLGAPVYLENDASMVGMGEAVYGPGKDKHIVVYLTISTGFGGARLIDGAIDKNALGFEPGHQIINMQGAKCECGGIGHVEAYISGPAIERRYGKKAEDLEDPQAFEEIAKLLGVALNNIIVHWSPEIVILGGSVMQKLLISRVRHYVKQTVVIFPNLPQIEKGTLGDMGGLYGALAYLNKRKELNL